MKGRFKWSNWTWSWETFYAGLMTEDFNRDSNRGIFENWCFRKGTFVVKAIWSISWKIDEDMETNNKCLLSCPSLLFPYNTQSYSGRGIWKVIPSPQRHVSFWHSQSWFSACTYCSDWSHICSVGGTHTIVDVPSLKITSLYIKMNLNHPLKLSPTASCVFLFTIQHFTKFSIFISKSNIS